MSSDFFENEITKGKAGKQMNKPKAFSLYHFFRICIAFKKQQSGKAFDIFIYVTIRTVVALFIEY